MGLFLLLPEPPSSRIVPLKLPELVQMHGSVGRGCLGWSGSVATTKAKEEHVASSESTHGKDLGAPRPPPWAVTESDPNTAPRGQH